MRQSLVSGLRGCEVGWLIVFSFCSYCLCVASSYVIVPGHPRVTSVGRLGKPPPLVYIAPSLWGRAVPGYVSPYTLFGWPRSGVVMTPNAATNHTLSLSSDSPNDKMRAPYLEVHVRTPYCLFGHVTPQGCPGYLHDLAGDLTKTKSGECPLYYFCTQGGIVTSD